MKLYLDDIREAPEGWVRTHTCQETIDILGSNEVDEVDLDFHLDGDIFNGHDVILWIKEQVKINFKYRCPYIYVHTADMSARKSMIDTIEEIKEIIEIKNAFKMVKGEFNPFMIPWRPSNASVQYLEDAVKQYKKGGSLSTKQKMVIKDIVNLSKQVLKKEQPN